MTRTPASSSAGASAALAPCGSELKTRSAAPGDLPWIHGGEHVGPDGQPAQMGMDLGQRLARRPLRPQERDLGVRMGGEQAQHLAPGIPGGTQHGDTNLFGHTA